jgi:hypothetical protein
LTSSFYVPELFPFAKYSHNMDDRDNYRSRDYYIDRPRPRDSHPSTTATSRLHSTSRGSTSADSRSLSRPFAASQHSSRPQARHDRSNSAQYQTSDRDHSSSSATQPGYRSPSQDIADPDPRHSSRFADLDQVSGSRNRVSRSFDRETTTTRQHRREAMSEHPPSTGYSGAGVAPPASTDYRDDNPSRRPVSHPRDNDRRQPRQERSPSPRTDHRDDTPDHRPQSRYAVIPANNARQDQDRRSPSRHASTENAPASHRIPRVSRQKKQKTSASVRLSNQSSSLQSNHRRSPSTDRGMTMAPASTSGNRMPTVSRSALRAIDVQRSAGESSRQPPAAQVPDCFPLCCPALVPELLPSALPRLGHRIASLPQKLVKSPHQPVWMLSQEPQPLSPAGLDAFPRTKTIVSSRFGCFPKNQKPKPLSPADLDASQEPKPLSPAGVDAFPRTQTIVSSRFRCFPKNQNHCLLPVWMLSQEPRTKNHTIASCRFGCFPKNRCLQLI